VVWTNWQVKLHSLFADLILILRDCHSQVVLIKLFMCNMHFKSIFGALIVFSSCWCRLFFYQSCFRGSQPYCSPVNICKAKHSIMSSAYSFKTDFKAITGHSRCQFAVSVFTRISLRTQGCQGADTIISTIFRYLLEVTLCKQRPLSQKISSNAPSVLCLTTFATPS
jgi:hypothetical protein